MECISITNTFFQLFALQLQIPLILKSNGHYKYHCKYNTLRNGKSNVTITHLWLEQIIKISMIVMLCTASVAIVISVWFCYRLCERSFNLFFVCIMNKLLNGSPRKPSSSRRLVSEEALRPTQCACNSLIVCLMRRVLIANRIILHSSQLFSL